MAISSTPELPLPDLLTTLRNLSGRLVFTELGSISGVEVFIASSFICGFYASGECMTEESDILEKLVAISASQLGRFSFETMPLEMINHRVRISIDQVNLAVVALKDEIAWRRSEFVSPTKVMVVDQIGCKFESVMLSSFFKRAYELFEKGIDAQQLAVKMQISLVQAQFYILKLLESGAIAVGKNDKPRNGMAVPLVIPPSRLESVATVRARSRN
ncbi:MAG TPA: hypothetical protein VF585_00255 [Chthoniobacterales bacterium]|jgi:hypothetical protein